MVVSSTTVTSGYARAARNAAVTRAVIAASSVNATPSPPRGSRISAAMAFPSALPASLAAALDALEATPEAAAWFGAAHLQAYLMHKTGELTSLAGLDEHEQCDRYAATY